MPCVCSSPNFVLNVLRRKGKKWKVTNSNLYLAPKAPPLNVAGDDPNENFGFAGASPVFVVGSTAAAGAAGGPPKLNLGAPAGVPADPSAAGFELLPNTDDPPPPLLKGEDVGVVLEPKDPPPPNAEVPFVPKADLVVGAPPKAFEAGADPKAVVAGFGASELVPFVPKADVVLAPPKALGAGADPNVGAGLGASGVAPLVARPPKADLEVALAPNGLDPNAEVAPPPPKADTGALGAPDVEAIELPPNAFEALPPPNADAEPPPNADFGASVGAEAAGLLGVPKLKLGLLAGAG